MARYTEANCRLCRREGKKLFLKGERCYGEKCALTRRESVPGQHGKGRKKTSEYATQLRAKQTAKRYYGVLESQFAAYFEKAAAVIDNVYSAGYLLKAGAVAEELGDNAKALSFYKKIKDQYPQSVEAYDVDKYIGRIENK